MSPPPTSRPTSTASTSPPPASPSSSPFSLPEPSSVSLLSSAYHLNLLPTRLLPSRCPPRCPRRGLHRSSHRYRHLMPRLLPRRRPPDRCPQPRHLRRRPCLRRSRCRSRLHPHPHVPVRVRPQVDPRRRRLRLPVGDHHRPPPRLSRQQRDQGPRRPLLLAHPHRHSVHLGLHPLRRHALPPRVPPLARQDRP